MSDIMLNFCHLKEHHRWYIVMAGDAIFFLNGMNGSERILDAVISLRCSTPNTATHFRHLCMRIEVFLLI